MTPEELREGLDLLERITGEWYSDYCGPDSVRADLHKAEEIIAALRGMRQIGHMVEQSPLGREHDRLVPAYTLEPPT